MKGRIATLSIDQLINYYENPRHTIGNSEEDTLKKLFDSVGIQYMLNLAEDIQKNGLLGNQQIVVVFSEELKKYIVYEGNRRIAVIKLLLYPEKFRFLDHTFIERAKKISNQGLISKEIECYITDEEEAFFIMERLHSGEDRGRGTKQWTPREKEAFKVRQSHQKKISFLIDFYSKKYFDGFDITTILPFTTIERIFNNREVKKKIGMDISNEQTFTEDRIQLVIDASKWIKQEAASAGLAVTRLFNKARTIEDRMIPWIENYLEENKVDDKGNAFRDITYPSSESTGTTDGSALHVGQNNSNSERVVDTNDGEKEISLSPNNSFGGDHNLPYFFQGLDYSHLDPNDSDSHGVAEICKELQQFSNNKLVAKYPIAATFLVRAVIEQSIIYYSKKHNIQGQNKCIWDDIKSIQKLSKIIEKYKKNLSNYIMDSSIRQYFTNLFSNYEENIDPLNWVVHKPAEFQLDTNTLVELPRKGLLKLVNYMIS